jgi:hypothetical protein
MSRALSQQQEGTSGGEGIPGARLELARLCRAVDFESTASANSAIPAQVRVQNTTGKWGSLASPVQAIGALLPIHGSICLPSSTHV